MDIKGEIRKIVKEVLTEDREAILEDELLRKKFPNIFLEKRKELREYWKNLHNEDFGKYNEEENIFENPMRWNLIYHNLLSYYKKQDKKLNEEGQRGIIAIFNLQKKVVEKEKKRRKMTKDELDFILWKFWTFLERRNDGLDLPEPSPFMLAVGKSELFSFKSAYKMHLESFFEIFPKKSKSK